MSIIDDIKLYSAFCKVREWIKGGNMLTGKRTYISAIALILHQIIKVVAPDYDVPQENLSTAIDVVLGLMVLIFRKLANKG